MKTQCVQRYEKPQLKFVELRNHQQVANVCWGGHGKDDTWYYDTSGEGYVSFQIGGGECALNLINVRYYESQEDQSPDFLQPSDPKYQEMWEALKNSGGAAGNPFKGEGVDFPLNPDPDWS